ncbi:MAG: response regulator [Micavibrio aeruginosavorus]|uniref:Response regulator n=1 Tax=Micavibrio aeruginosavorus TaxID=349221 RepID=A0A2W5FB84_9BACT|nr:MAG: response regulator [Micavibrio aeruginosavorus]
MHKSNVKLDKLRVMIVDDQADMRGMIRHMLAELGVNQVFEAIDGKQAMAFMDDAIDMIDLVICDWNMPVMSGVEVLRQLRSVDHDMPFLMVTGRNDINSVSEAKASGVTAYISKPFSLDQLENKIKIIVSRAPHGLSA